MRSCAKPGNKVVTGCKDMEESSDIFGSHIFSNFDRRACLCNKNKCNDIEHKFDNTPEPTGKSVVTSNF